MTDVIVRATAVHWESDNFPGWVQVVITDGAGRPHRIIEKVPALTHVDITAASVFSIELWLPAACQGMDSDDMIVRLGHGMTTTEGRCELRVAVDDVRRL